MDKHSPLPWAVRAHLPDAHFDVVADAAGNTVGTATRPADADLIVAAVNGLADALSHADDCARAAAAEHSARARDVEDAQREANARADRLRDLVRRLADNLRRYHILGDRDNALLREAREALGEEAP